MEFEIDVRVKVSIPGDLANVHEVCVALKEVRDEFVERLGAEVLESYQEVIRDRLCLAKGDPLRRELGKHPRKDKQSHRCRCRRFKRSGWWSQPRRLRTDLGQIAFGVSMVQCLGCGRRFAPILKVLGLAHGQRATEQLVRVVTESISETSYRRGSDWMEGQSGIPIAKSTAHRWGTTVMPTFALDDEIETMMADGTGYKRQPGTRGEVRMVLGIGPDRTLRPLGVWAGTTWKAIAKDLRRLLRGKERPKLLVTDGEWKIEKYLGDLVKGVQRCQWHFVRESTLTAWKDGVVKQERTSLRDQLKHMVAIEIPASDIEMVSPEEREELAERIRIAKRKLSQLATHFEGRGYVKMWKYLTRAQERLFGHLEQWLETGIVGHRTTSIIECIIRELVRRLKKLGWNWSDEGAERMGRIVILRRYDDTAWEAYWRERLGLQDRCQMEILWCRKAA